MRGWGFHLFLLKSALELANPCPQVAFCVARDGRLVAVKQVEVAAGAQPFRDLKGLPDFPHLQKEADQRHIHLIFIFDISGLESFLAKLVPNSFNDFHRLLISCESVLVAPHALQRPTFPISELPLQLRIAGALRDFQSCGVLFNRFLRGVAYPQ